MNRFETSEILMLAYLGLAFVLVILSRRSKAADGMLGVMGLLLFVMLLGNQVREWWIGHWTIGRYLTPVEIMGPDGRHLDGTPVNSFNTSSPAVWWCVYLVLGGMLVYLCWLIRCLKRMEAKYAARGQHTARSSEGIRFLE